MESTVREVTSVRREIDFTLSRQEIDPYFNRVYRQAQQKVQLKGFRHGKTPLTLIKKMYGASLDSEAIEQAVQTEFGKYAQEQHLHPIGTPTITKIERTEDEGLSFTIVYDVIPDFELADYKGLSATKYYHIVTDEELQAELDHLAERFVTPEPAEYVENENFYVTVDLQKLDESGEPIEGEGTKDLKVYLRREGMNPELKASLMNAKVGDVQRIELPTGEDEAMTPYEMTVTQVQRVVLPDFDDEFAQKIVGDPEATIDDLKEMLRRNIENAYETRYGRFFREELVSKLLERHSFEVPETLVHEALHSFIEDLKQQNPKKELPPDFDRAKYEQEMRPAAMRTVQWALIRERIIQAENLQVFDEDYEGLADVESQRTGMDYQKLLNYYKNTPHVQDRILVEKAVQVLEDFAVIQEMEDLDAAAQQQVEPAGEE